MHLKKCAFQKKICELQEPGCIGMKLGRIQNSGGSGLQPDHSYTPSTCTKEEAFHIYLQEKITSG